MTGPREQQPGFLPPWNLCHRDSDVKHLSLSSLLRASCTWAWVAELCFGVHVGRGCELRGEGSLCP